MSLKEAGACLSSLQPKGVTVPYLNGPAKYHRAFRAK